MTTLETIGQILLMGAALFSGAAFGGGLFDVTVNEDNLIRGFPDSIRHVRAYWKYRNPGDFYKRITPLIFLTSIASLVIFWDAAYGRRWLIMASIGCYAATQLITVIYFFPQNKILREGPLDEVAKLVREFSTTRLYLDLFRNVLTGAGTVLLLIALSRSVN